MPDTFARMRQLIGTTVEWAANDLVIGLGEIAVERAGAEFKIKVGDGSSRFSALPYASGATANVAWGNITGKPAVFPPADHDHALEDVTGLVDGQGKINLAVIPDTLKERLDWRGKHTPTVPVPYPQNPVAGDTWGIAGASFTFTTGSLAGKTVAEGAAIVYDAGTWFLISGGSTINPADYVKTADLRTTSTGSTEAGKVPQLNASGRLDPSMLNVPGQLNFRGTVDIRQAVPSSVNSGDYYLVGIGGVAHASWVGIAGQTMQVNDQVIWNGLAWSYVRPTGAAGGFLPIDGSVPMTGPLALAPYTAGQPAAAHAVRKDHLTATLDALPSAAEDLGFVPLNPANNLSELTDDATARSNIGLGTMAVEPAASYVAKSTFLNANELLISTGAGAVARLAAPSIDGQLLGHSGGTVGWTLGSNVYLLKAQNLADVPDKAEARANLGIASQTDIILKSTIDAAGDLIVGTAPDTVARLGKGTAGQMLKSTAGGVAWAGDYASEVSLGAPSNELIIPLPAGAKLVGIACYLEVATGAGGIYLRGRNAGTPDATNAYTVTAASIVSNSSFPFIVLTSAQWTLMGGGAIGWTGDIKLWLETLTSAARRGHCDATFSSASTNGRQMHALFVSTAIAWTELAFSTEGTFKAGSWARAYIR